MLGRPVRAVKRPIEDWVAWARGRGWPEWSVTTYIHMCEHYDAHGYAGGNPLALRAILGREPGGYRAFAERFVREQTA